MQIKIAFQNVTADQAKTAVIAYEPIWGNRNPVKLQIQIRLRKFAGAIWVSVSGEIYDECRSYPVSSTAVL